AAPVAHVVTFTHVDRQAISRACRSRNLFHCVLLVVPEASMVRRRGFDYPCASTHDAMLVTCHSHEAADHEDEKRKHPSSALYRTIQQRRKTLADAFARVRFDLHAAVVPQLDHSEIFLVGYR